MKSWESLMDKKIREAMERGEFDNLPGKGEPVDLSENPFEDPELRLAHRMLRSAGFAPSWIEERKDIDAAFLIARTNLERKYSILKQSRGTEHESGAKARWDNVLVSFRAQMTQLNRRIAAWNLKVPTQGFQRRSIDCEVEIRRVTGQASVGARD